MTTPCLWFSRGEPQAKLLGTFSLVRFFGVSKEMNVKCFEQLSFVLLIQLSGHAEACLSKISPFSRDDILSFKLHVVDALRESTLQTDCQIVKEFPAEDGIDS